jgi:uncharacterized protein (DUF362 family)
MRKTKATSEEFAVFDNAMTAILRADPTTVRAQMEADKRANAKKRKAKEKPSASGRASVATD